MFLLKSCVALPTTQFTSDQATEIWDSADIMHAYDELQHFFDL